jgi:N-carbamoylputrescine amidase
MIDLRIAMIACRAPVGAVEENLARMAHWVRRARRAGADLVCFPELNVTGYTTSVSMTEFALSIPGAITDRISQIAREARLTILAGMAEHNDSGLPYASHGVFLPDGRIEIYRKLHLAPPERSIFSSGHGVPIFTDGKTTFGLQLCYDAHFPELSTAMAARGVEVIFMPHASPRGNAAAKHQSWLRHLPARAFDNGIFVAACNQWGDNGRRLNFPGNAVVIGPDGKVIKKRSTARNEGMLLAELRGEDLAAVRNHPMRYFFPRRRPDIYRMGPR